MAIDGEKFLEWAESRFPRVSVKGNEVRIPSPFLGEDDPHLHCWCRVDGYNKKGEERPLGIYHCFKTDNEGDLAGLIMLIDGCEYDEALNIIDADRAGMAEIERQLDEMFAEKYGSTSAYAIKPKAAPPKTLQLPMFCWKTTELASNDRFRISAEIYLQNRKLPLDRYYIGTVGKWRERIIIPYYDRDGNLIYYNGRYYGANTKIGRYLGPDEKESPGVGKADVIYMPVWPTPGSRVYLNEGEFDADSIVYGAESIGEKAYACAFGGKTISEKQIEMLRPYIPVLGVDTDRAGRQALCRICQELRSAAINPMWVKPPPPYKDWNAMLQKVHPRVMLAYIRQNERPMTDQDLLLLMT